MKLKADERRVKWRYVAFILLFLICTNIQMAFADNQVSSLSVLLNSDENTVTIHCKLLNVDQELPVTIVIQNPAIADQKKYIMVEEGKTDAGGNWDFVYNLPKGMPSGTYKVLAKCNGTPAVKEISFQYENRDAINAVNNAEDAAAMKAALLNYSGTLGVSLDNFNDAKLNITAVTQKLFDNKPYADTQAFADKYNLYMALEYVKDSTPAATGDKSVITALQEYSDIFNIELDGQSANTVYYNSAILNDSARTRIREALAGKSFDSPDLTLTTYENELLLEAVNCNVWPNIKNAFNYSTPVKQYNIILDLSGKYQQLKDQSIPYKALVDKSFTDADAIKTAFANAVQQQYDKENGTTDDGGGSRGSGSSHSSTSVTVSKNYSPANAVGVDSGAAANNNTVFTDIANEPWAAESIQALASKGIVTGKGNGIFDPDSTVTREEFIKMLIGALNLVDESASVDFTDVRQDDWYYKYVASASKYGITSGIDNEQFGVGNKITRQEMAVMVYKAANSKSITLSDENNSINFSDLDQIASYAVEAVQNMQSTGIINGMGDGRFAPEETATRAQAAKIIYNLVKLQQ